MILGLGGGGSGESHRHEKNGRRTVSHRCSPTLPNYDWTPLAFANRDRETLLPVWRPTQAEPGSEVDEVAEVPVVFGFCRAQHDPMVVIACQ